MRTCKEQRTTVSAAAMVAAAITCTTAFAAATPATDSGPPRVALGSFRGPESAKVREAIEDQLVTRYVLLPEALVSESARRSGTPLRTEKAFAQVGKELNVAAFVSATVRHRGAWRVEMTVHHGDTGRPLGQFDWSDRHIDKLTPRLGRALAKRLDALLGSRAVSPSSRPSAKVAGSDAGDVPERKIDRAVALAGRAAPTVVQDDEPGESADATVHKSSGPETPAPVRSYFEVRVGGRVFNRNFAYTDNFSGLPGYKVDGAFAVETEVALHPFALLSGLRESGMASLGLTGALTYAPGFQSSASSSGNQRATQVHGYEIGARQRSAIGAVELMPRVGYLVDSFSARLGELSPDVTYRAGRVGLLTRYMASDRATIFGSIDYLHVFSVGTVSEDRFPRATVRGVDLSLGAGYRLTDSLEVQLLSGLRRYAFAMHARPTDAVIVGGASDQFLSMTLGLAYRPSLERN